MKIKVEINKTENRKENQQNQKLNFENINKTSQPLAKPREKEKAQSTKIYNERGNITIIALQK